MAEDKPKKAGRPPERLIIEGDLEEHLRRLLEVESRKQRTAAELAEYLADEVDDIQAVPAFNRQISVYAIDEPGNRIPVKHFFVSRNDIMRAADPAELETMVENIRTWRQVVRDQNYG